MNRPQKLIKLKACGIIFTEDIFKDDVFVFQTNGGQVPTP